MICNIKYYLNMLFYIILNFDLDSICIGEIFCVKNILIYYLFLYNELLIF